MHAVAQPHQTWLGVTGVVQAPGGTRENALCIVGASVRAAAYSARRAGYCPYAADQFGDRDLGHVAAACHVTSLQASDGLLSWLAEAPAAGWIYTGALENRWRLLKRLAGVKTLYGNPPEVARRSRDPFRWTAILREAGLPYLDVLSPTELKQVHADGSWVVKPLLSAGGRLIRILDRHSGSGASGLSAATLAGHYYLQKRCHGRSCSALFIGEKKQAHLVAIAEQFIGRGAFGARDFTYCGGAAPLDLPLRAREQIAQIGTAFAAGLDLVGVFGVDFLYDGTDCWVTEINPRYTASVELVELATGESILQKHMQVCQGTALAPAKASEGRGGLSTASCKQSVRSSPAVPVARQIVAKAILYAPRRLVFPDSGPWDNSLSRQLDVWSLPDYADIPRPGAAIRSGAPILTIFACAATTAAALSELCVKASQVYHILGCRPAEAWDAA